MLFGTLNSRIGKTKTPSDFICTDESVIQRYLDDPLCGYVVSAEYIAEMMWATRKSCTEEYYSLKDKKKPIFTKKPQKSLRAEGILSCAASGRCGFVWNYLPSVASS